MVFETVEAGMSITNAAYRIVGNRQTLIILRLSGVAKMTAIHGICKVLCVLIYYLHFNFYSLATAPPVPCRSRVRHASGSRVRHACNATRDSNLPELCLQLCFGTGDFDDRALRIMRPQLRLDLGYGKALGSLGLFGF